MIFFCFLFSKIYIDQTCMPTLYDIQNSNINENVLDDMNVHVDSQNVTLT